MAVYDYETSAPIADSLPPSPTEEEEEECAESTGDDPRRKTRRSRRGGYRRKRQQEKEVAALLATSAAKKAGQAEACGYSTATTDGESSSCESSTAGSSISTTPRPCARKRINNHNKNAPVWQPTYQQPAHYNGYPVNTPPQNTNSYKPSGPRRNQYLQPERFLALDCEMVGVGKDGIQSALARVTLLDWNGHVVMDEYIKPGRKVTDYRSFVSGITPDILKNEAKMDYATCRKKVIMLLRGKILVGHALENDLGVLRINHPWFMVRDTARYQPYMKVRYQDGAGAFWPRRLQDLAREQLSRNVQVYGRPHCPQEDALAALDLYKLAACEWEKSMEYTLNKTWAIQQQQQQQYAAAVYAM